MHRSIAFFAALILGGCAVGSRPSVPVLPEGWSRITLTSAQIEKVKTGVAKGLKDPESARFDGPFTATAEGDTIHVCGYVNAKNSYGGYVGMKPFYAVGEKSTGVFVGIAYGGEMYRATDIGSSATLEMCARAGISVT